MQCRPLNCNSELIILYSAMVKRNQKEIRLRKVTILNKVDTVCVPRRKFDPETVSLCPIHHISGLIKSPSTLLF